MEPSARPDAAQLLHAPSNSGSGKSCIAVLPFRRSEMDTLLPALCAKTCELSTCRERLRTNTWLTLIPAAMASKVHSFSRYRVAAYLFWLLRCFGQQSLTEAWKGIALHTLALVALQVPSASSHNSPDNRRVLARQNRAELRTTNQLQRIYTHPCCLSLLPLPTSCTG